VLRVPSGSTRPAVSWVTVREAMLSESSLSSCPGLALQDRNMSQRKKVGRWGGWRTPSEGVSRELGRGGLCLSEAGGREPGPCGSTAGA